MFEQAVNRAVQQVEIWQAQNYWPIKGWAAPLSGTPHYSCHLLPSGGCDTFPDDLPPLPGWEWTDKWTLDSSSRCGQPDGEGWLYATTFDRLAEMMKNGIGSGVASKTSLVRKRRWLRSMICNNPEINEAIAKRIDTILVMLRNIDSSLKDKETAVKSVKFYEENRSFVFSQSLHLATQGTLNTLTLVKDLGGKLKHIKQYLQDRAVVERDYAMKVEALAKKYWIPPINTNNTDTSLSPLSLPNTSEEETQTTLSDLFFSKVHATSLHNSRNQIEFANNLTNLITTEIDQMLLEIHTVLKEARMVFRKNSDICRLSEAAIRNFLASVTIAFESVNNASLKDITDLTEELNILKGASAYSAQTFATILAQPKRPSFSKRKDHITTVSQAMSAGYKGSQRDDIWLAVQRYKLAVRDSQEALCVLISDSMDLELQQQIFANRVHVLYSNLVKSYVKDEVELLTDLKDMWMRLQNEVFVKIQMMRLPYPVLQSPFAQLQQTLDGEEEGQTPTEKSFLTMTPGKPDTNEEENNVEEARDKVEGVGESRVEENSVIKNCNKETQEEEEEVVVFSTPNKKPVDDTPARRKQQDERASVAIGMGIFSFTFLYREPLPRAPGVVRSGTLLLSPAGQFLRSKNVLFDAIWKTVYLIATSDGYVHLLSKKKSDIPDRSFYIKDTIINETPRDEKNVESNALIFELSLAHNNAQNKTKAMFQESIFFRCETPQEAAQWVEDLLQLTLLRSHVDEEVEVDARGAMLASLPILKGETAKIDLELQRYENLQSMMTSPSPKDSNNEVETNEEFNTPAQRQDTDGKEDDSYHQQEGNVSDEDDDLLPLEERKSIAMQQTQLYGDYSQLQEEDGYEEGEILQEGEQEDGQATGDSSQTQPKRYIRQSNTSYRSSNNKEPRKSYVYGSNFTKEDTTWKPAHALQPARRTSSIYVGVTPVNADLKPRQVIPVVDRSVPLARKHSTLIAQYEQALQKEKELVESRVKETRGKRLQDTIDVLPELPPSPVKQKIVTADEKPDQNSLEVDISVSQAVNNHNQAAASSVSPSEQTISSVGSTDESGGGNAEATSRRAPRRLVKTLSQKFDPAAMISSSNSAK